MAAQAVALAGGVDCCFLVWLRAFGHELDLVAALGGSGLRCTSSLPLRRSSASLSARTGHHDQGHSSTGGFHMLSLFKGLVSARTCGYNTVEAIALSDFNPPGVKS